MSTINQKAKLGLGLFTTGLAVMALVAASTTAQAQSGSGYFDVRSIFTGPLGITSPMGVAFATPSNNLVIFDTPRAGQTGAAMVLVKYREETAAGSQTVAVADPLNLALNGADNRYWMLDQAASSLIDMPARSDGAPDVQSSQQSDVRPLGIQNAQGMSFDPRTGRLFILDSERPRILEIVPDAQGNLNPAAAASSGRLAEVNLAWLGAGQLRGLAFNPSNGHLYVMDSNGPKLYELTETGTLVTTRDLAELRIASPQGMVFGPSVDNTDNPATLNLYAADAGRGNKGGRIIELSLDEVRPRAAMVAVAAPELVQTIETWEWSPPSPDPSGIVFWPATGRLLMTDSEVDEIPDLFTGDNVFEIDLDGTLASSYSTMSFSSEPTGVAVNIHTGHLMFSKDGGSVITDVNFGEDGEYGTSDDNIRSFSVSGFGVLDAEDLALGDGKLFIADGKNQEVWVIRPGDNDRFDGPPPEGDDTATHFDTSVLGVRDPEGIAYDPASGYLWLCSRGSPIVQVTTGGVLVRSYDISFLDPIDPDGITLAPGSNNASEQHLYVADRMVDNGEDPDENDGRIYELVVDLGAFPGATRTPTSTPTTEPTLAPTPVPTLPSSGGAFNVFLPFLTRPEGY